MDWLPKTSVGPFRFGEPVSTYIDEFALEKVEYPDDVTGWESFYYRREEAHIHSEGGVVVSVTCYRSFMVGGKEIIGLPLVEAQELLRSEPSEFGDALIISDGWQIPVEFEELCLQVWVIKEAPQIVASVTATDD